MATPKRKSDERQQKEDEERPSTWYLSDVTSSQVEKLKQKVVPKNTDRLGLKNMRSKALRHNSKDDNTPKMQVDNIYKDLYKRGIDYRDKTCSIQHNYSRRRAVME